MNLAGSQGLQDMKNKTDFTVWKTETGGKGAEIKPPADHLFERKGPLASGHNYSLEPQRIRVFNIRYELAANGDTDLLKAIKDLK